MPFNRQNSIPNMAIAILINLERNAYNDYTSLRSFSNHSNLMDKGNIHFTFENGLFGIKVLKEYRFEQ